MKDNGIGRDVAKAIIGIVCSGLLSIFLSVVTLRDWAIGNLRDHPIEFVSGFLIAAVLGGSLTYFIYGGWRRIKDRKAAQRDLEAKARELEHSYELRLIEHDRVHDREMQDLRSSHDREMRDLRSRPSREQFDELAERIRYLESASHRMTETIRSLPQAQKAALWYAYTVKGDPFSSQDCNLSGELEALAGHGALDRVRVDGSTLTHYVISPAANEVVSGDPALVGELEAARDALMARRARARRDSLFAIFKGLTPYEKFAIVDLYRARGHSGHVPGDLRRDLLNGTVALGSLIETDEIDPGSTRVCLADGVVEMLDEHADYFGEVCGARDRDRLRRESERISESPSHLLACLNLRGMTALSRLVAGDIRLEHYEEGDLAPLYDHDLILEHERPDGGCDLELRPDVQEYFSTGDGSEELDMAIADLERIESGEVG